jgi:ribosomal protein S18 acetylase RimI-like enzyme
LDLEKEIEIIPFKKELASSFKALNIAWLEKYFSVEPHDEVVLSDPEEHIIKKGGHIYFAQYGDAIVGTFALLKQEDGVFELGKMAVSEQYQGKNIGNKLLQHCMEEAKRLGASKVVLFSNTLLGPAIHLYKKYGFKDVPMGYSEYKRSNIKMEKQIKTL